MRIEDSIETIQCLHVAGYTQAVVIGEVLFLSGMDRLEQEKGIEMPRIYLAE